MISRSIWTKALLCPLVLSTPCPRRNLWLCVSSSTRTWPLGLSIPHTHPMGPQFSLSIKNMVHYGFVSILEDSIGFPKKTDIHFCSSLTSYMHHDGHEFTPRLISDMHTIWSELQPETDGKSHSEPDMALSSGW